MTDNTASTFQGVGELAGVRTRLDQQGTGGIAVAASGSDIAQNIKIVISGAQARQPSLKFVPWQRRSTPCKIDDEFCDKLRIAEEELRTRNFVTIETSLRSFAEDGFQAFLDAEHFAGEAWEAIRAPEASNDEFAINNVLSDLSKAKPNSLLFIDLLRAMPDTVQRDFRAELEAPETSQLGQVLRYAKVFCLVFIDVTQQSSSSVTPSAITFSYEDEKRALLSRAAISEGAAPYGFVAGAIEDQLQRSMWTTTLDGDQLHELDAAIRSGKVLERAHKLRESVAQVDKAEREYSNRLRLLLQADDVESGRKLRLKSLTLPWPEEVTYSLVEHALFVLTHFEGLTSLEFRALMKRMLRGKSVVHHERHGDQSRELADANGRGPGAPPAIVEIVERTLSLEAAYDLSPDRILALVEVVPRDGRLAFDPVTKAKVAREILLTNRPTFAESMLVHETLEKGIPFAEPSHVAKQLIARHAEYVSKLAEVGRKELVYGWMNFCARHILERATAQLERNGLQEDKRDLETLLGRLSGGATDGDGRSLKVEYAERLEVYFSCLLASPDPSVRALVDAALERLMTGSSQRRASHDLVFLLVRMLRRHSSFRALFWLKRLLAESDEDTKRNALDYVAWGLAQGIDFGTAGVRAEASLITALREWLVPGVRYASGMSTQAAALLVPRIALYRSFGRINEQDHGSVDQLTPLFDLRNENGLPVHYSAAIELLSLPIGGTWIRNDLRLLNQFVGARWQLDTSPEVGTQSDVLPIALDECPLLRSLLKGYATASWTDIGCQRLALAVLFIEAIAAMVGTPGPPTSDDHNRRLAVCREVLLQLAANLAKSAHPDYCVRSLMLDAYALDKGLSRNRSPAAQRRGRCARWIGNELHQLQNAGSRQKEGS